jgi:aminoglycoside phosphotransferase (APT) family kinase protein
MSSAAPGPHGSFEACLASWGLQPAIDSPETPGPGKNETLLCQARGRSERVLVKRAHGLASHWIRREGIYLQVVAPLAAVPGSPLDLPRLWAFDAKVGALALEWIPEGEPLHVTHRRHHRYEEATARRIGRGLAFLHRASHANPARFCLEDGFREQSDPLESFVRLRPDYYVRLNRATLRLFSSVHHDGEALAALHEMSAFDPAGGALVHGDFRLVNLLHAGRGERTRLVFLDWELAHWGEPARDLGSILTDYTLLWLDARSEAAAAAAPAIRAFLRALLEAYREERGSEFSLEQDFSARVVRWAALALLVHVHTMTRDTGVFDEQAALFTQYGLDMLATPEPWESRLWGEGP